MKHKRIDGPSRFYEIDGKRYASVTSILSVISKPALIAWAAKQGSLQNMLATQQEAMDIGSSAHRIIEAHLKNEPYLLENEPREVQQAFANFLEWAKQTNFQIVHSEFVCYSELGYAGTADGIAKIDGELTVIDWKTSSGIYDDYWLQTEAYANAIDEMVARKELQLFEEPITNVSILRLSKKDGSFEAVTKKRDPRNLGTFVHAMHLWEWQQRCKEAYDNKNRRRKKRNSS